eukprot:6481970-Amphidinium_carterae.1
MHLCNHLAKAPQACVHHITIVGALASMHARQPIWNPGQDTVTMDNKVGVALRQLLQKWRMAKCNESFASLTVPWVYVKFPNPLLRIEV